MIVLYCICSTYLVSFELWLSSCYDHCYLFVCYIWNVIQNSKRFSCLKLWNLLVFAPLALFTNFLSQNTSVTTTQSFCQLMNSWGTGHVYCCCLIFFAYICFGELGDCSFEMVCIIIKFFFCEELLLRLVQHKWL